MSYRRRRLPAPAPAAPAAAAGPLPPHHTADGDWLAFLARVARPPVSPGFARTTHESDERTTFTGVATFDDAVRLARDGWADGLARVAPLAAAFTRDVAARVERDVPTFDVEGIGIDVARYVDGEPEAWLRFDRETTSGLATRHVHVLLNAAVSHNVAHHVIERRGAAIYALVDLLELAGFRVTLTVATRAQRRGADVAHAVTVKAPSQPLDPARVIFACVHPAMLRRLLLRTYEHAPGTYHPRLGAGYGVPTDVDIPADVTLPALVSYDDVPNWGADGTPWASDESTRQWLRAQLSDHGVHVRE